MDIGSLDTRITIEARGPGFDAGNQPLKAAWAPVRQLWASVRHKSGTETIKSDAPASVVQASIRIHWRTDITAAMRVRIDTTVYQIQAVLPDYTSRAYVDLVCQVVTGHG